MMIQIDENVYINKYQITFIKVTRFLVTIYLGNGDSCALNADSKYLPNVMELLKGSDKQ